MERLGCSFSSTVLESGTVVRQMTFEEFRREMNEYRKSAEERAKELKDPQIVSEKLHSLYRSFDAQERIMADGVVIEWVLSGEEGIRFDALALVEEFRIRTAIPALLELVSRLGNQCTPGAPFERAKTDRIIAELTRK
jgi:hypothetical protein